MTMASLSPVSSRDANTNSKPAHAKALTDLDFHSGARIEEINKLIQEFGKHELREYDDQRALEVHTAKDFIFSMLGEPANPLPPSLPPSLLLSLTPSLARSLVHSLTHSLTLSLPHSRPPSLPHSRPRGVGTGLGGGGGGAHYFSPTRVADWFFRSVSAVIGEIRSHPQRGVPRVEKVEQNGTVVSVILRAGGSRMLYDIVPVVSFKGWPAVAQNWLMENHFWDGKITEEEVISGFYLVPACSASGDPQNEWRLAFSRSEVQLKKCISPALIHAYQAYKAVIIKLLSRPKAISPYHLRSLMLWACDRLPSSFLSQDDNTAHFLLGLIDDLSHCLVNKSCPSYFLPQCNMFEHLSDETVLLLACKLSSVRTDPAEHLRTAIEHAKAANKLAQELRKASRGVQASQSDGVLVNAGRQDDSLARKLQQLVTENPGKSISVFLNPEDVSKPHFRIDDKFF
uniref:Protein MB21D2 n=1 Tax=Callorhinchus milii TaxID=7868 RepID=A0A4W3H072_CALMI